MSSIGKIALDLSVNSKGFNKQVGGIEKQATKAFGGMSVAIGNIMSSMVQKAVASVGNFVKDSINKGSELSELQNVVDSVFTTMSDKVESFSKNALSAYGLTETQSKKMVGTFGAMSKSFGYSEQQAYDMSTALTGLAGDVASFYNLNHDEAYTKLKSVFTGETESLKELGVVMTQTALDEFAMANGFGKTTAKMSEQEKVALRLAFVQAKLSTASGDFARTQDQWANQTRILAGQFESLKAALGQGFINILTPVIKMLNTLMAKLVQAANVFKSFTETIMGKKTGGGAGAVMSEVAEAAQSAAGSTSVVEDSAEGAAVAAKKAQKSLMGFDEINKLSSNESAESSGSSGGEASGSSDMSFGGVDIGSTAEETASVTIPLLDSIISKAKELVGLFKEGFKDGLGADFEASLLRTQEHIQGIWGSLKSIFSDPQVVGAANTWANSFAYSLGQVIGSIASIGQTIVENLVGGIDVFLSQNSGFIKTRIAETLNASAEIFTMVGDMWAAVASIFEVFRGDTAKQITGDIIAIISNASLGIWEIATKIGRDIINCISQPIIDNQEAFKLTIENTLAPISDVLSVVSEGVRQTFEKMSQVYDEKVQPMFQSLADGFSDIVATLLDAYNTHIAPVLDEFADKFEVVWAEHIQPAIDKIIDFIGKLAETIQTLWETVLQPVIKWLINTLAPVVSTVIRGISDVVLGIFKTVSTVVSDIIDVLSGILDFIVNVFTGDWDAAFETLGSIIEDAAKLIKDAFQGIWDFIKGIFNTILAGLESLVNGFAGAINGMIDGINSLSFTVPDWVPGIGGEEFGFNLGKIKTVTLPRLAEGGYVRANQPQPVIIGDNKTQGEIVSPEGKMFDVMIDALKTFFSQLQQSGYKATTNEGVGDIVIPIYLDGTMLDEVIVSAQQRRNIRSGGR